MVNFDWLGSRAYAGFNIALLQVFHVHPTSAHLSHEPALAGLQQQRQVQSGHKGKASTSLSSQGCH